MRGFGVMKKPEKGHDWALIAVIDKYTNLHICLNCKAKISSGVNNKGYQAWFWTANDSRDPFCPDEIPSCDAIKMDEAMK